MTDLLLNCLQEALVRLLGVPEAGTVAYIRCLPGKAIAALAANAEFCVPGWDIYAVGADIVSGKRWITADRAVDLREEKQESILLLVDSTNAAAGMDGIYSAGREVSENVLLEAAMRAARKRMTPPLRDFVTRAERQAKRLGRVHSLAPYRVFEFLAICAACPEDAGGAVALLGLWPIAADDELRAEDLEVSALMVERLLLTGGASSPPRARVVSLLLPDEAGEQKKELETLLREGEGRRWTETVLAAREHPHLWLNRLKPGFAAQQLIALKLASWRGTGGKLLAWSGLVSDQATGLPAFLLEPAGETPGRRASDRKLEVRWKVQPTGIPAGVVEYAVEIVTDSGNVLAARKVQHKKNETQSCALTRGDFEDLDEGKWVVRVRVHPVGEPEPEDAETGESSLWGFSEEFLLGFGEVPEKTLHEGAGKKVRALSEAVVRCTPDDFASAAKGVLDTSHDGSDRPPDYVTCRMGEKSAQRSARVSRPALIRQAEASWRKEGFAVGRWVVSVRADGSAAGPPRFEPLSLDDLGQELRKKLEDRCRAAGVKAMERGGFVGVIYRASEWANEYVNVWAEAVETAPHLALAQTVEVRSLSGETLGLIVLPGHPLLVAWHQAYDELVYHACYSEKLQPAEVVKTLEPLDGSYFPSFLPGLQPGETFVFGDMLGFYAVAMLRAGELEPQAAIAQMARCLSPLREDAAPSVGATTGVAVGREIARYTELHPEYSLLKLHALHPGDGLTVARALGEALRRPQDREEDSDRERTQGFYLELYPSLKSRDARLTGGFLSETTERRRAGVGSLPAQDRWMLESYNAGGEPLPLLRWARRKPSTPDDAAHLSLAFDTFASRVEVFPDADFPPARPLEVYGLAPSQVREFDFAPAPTWRTTAAPQVDTEKKKHPASPALTDRLLRIHTAVLRATAANLGGGAGDWPALVTSLSPDNEDHLHRLHELSDWVITVDRNAGIEYFDAPGNAPKVYETYVIDCVPERQDLDTVQLVTSTSHVEEVKRLLDQTLAEMALTCSARNCEFLLSNLKAVSGRLAMRLASHTTNRGELIALALFHAGCAGSGDAQWLSLHDGFFVPLDDVRELLPNPPGDRRKSVQQEPRDAGTDDGAPAEASQTSHRCDLIHVSLSRRGALQFRFVEVKFRRLLKSARSIDLQDQVKTQIASTRERWMKCYFGPELTATQLAMRRKRLAHALGFYLEKARRHHLKDDPYTRLGKAIDRLFQPGAELSRDPVEDRGYVFCPDHSDPVYEIAGDGLTRVLLFGPTSLPDRPASAIAARPVLPPQPDGSAPRRRTPPLPSAVLNTSEAPEAEREPVVAAAVSDNNADALEAASEDAQRATPGSGRGGNGEAEVLLGQMLNGDTPVSWRISLQGNPHLLIAGLPGMGKTTCLVNLCAQLVEQGITPIVFSYHQDLEEKLAARLGHLNTVDVESGLGFNPMRVTGSGPNAWKDNVGMLRDIFASVYPDLGDRQTNEIREALRQTYTEQGFDDSGVPDSHEPPAFQRFFDLLRRAPKPNQGLMARLGELNDYGFFRSTGDQSTLLESREPVVLRLHTTQSEKLQNATASFALFRLYQNMFQRGVQEGLTHAIVFDEAHRASRLKLLPTMAKECRKFGLSLVVASQEAKDFNASLYSAIANYLVFRVTDADARALSQHFVPRSDAPRLAGRLKQLDKYTALFVAEGQRQLLIRLQG